MLAFRIFSYATEKTSPVPVVQFANLTGVRQQALLAMRRAAMDDKEEWFGNHAALAASASVYDTEWVVDWRGKTYYANTEGYGYPRYAFEIAGFPALATSGGEYIFDKPPTENRVEQLRSALEAARGLIVSHHSRLHVTPGTLCPVCTAPDGDAVLNQVAAALQCAAPAPAADTHPKFCNRPSPDNSCSCSEPRGHSGDHVARFAGSGSVIECWPHETAAEAEAAVQQMLDASELDAADACQLALDREAAAEKGDGK